MRQQAQPSTAAPVPSTRAHVRAGALWLLVALTVAAFTDRFTTLHTDERTAAAITAAAATLSIALTAANGSTPPLRRLSGAAGIYIVAVLAATWLVVDMTTAGW